MFLNTFPCCNWKSTNRVCPHMLCQELYIVIGFKKLLNPTTYRILWWYISVLKLEMYVHEYYANMNPTINIVYIVAYLVIYLLNISIWPGVGNGNYIIIHIWIHIQQPNCKNVKQNILPFYHYPPTQYYIKYSLTPSNGLPSTHTIAISLIHRHHFVLATIYYTFN